VPPLLTIFTGFIWPSH